MTEIKFMKSLASDNYAGVIPEVINAIAQVNTGHESSYGQDQFSARVGDLFQNLFGRKVQYYFAFNGTGANLLGLSSILKPYEAVVCMEYAHIYVDESTAPELFTGARLRAVPINKEGKLDPEKIAAFCIRKGDMHYAQCKAVTITQSTEYGTVYTPDEIKKISIVCKENNLYLHVDGARILNAAASLGISLQEMCTETGVDLLTFGITKAGALAAEAVVFINPELGEMSAFFQKRNAQLCSKSRFIAAQFLGMLENENWKKYTLHANQMAKVLAEKLHHFEQIFITKPVQSNAVFAIMPAEWILQLQKVIPFYIWNEQLNEVRLMCSWDTTEADINSIIMKLEELGEEK